MRTKVFVALAVVALGFFAIASSPALAAPGGKGGGKGGKPGSTTATCVVSVSPNPVSFGSNITVTATGFTAYQQVTIDRDGAGYGMFADSTGKVTLVLSSGAVGGHTVTGLALVSSTWKVCGSTTYTTR